MNETQRFKVTGRAVRYVRLLQDYGHLDDLAADRLLIAGWSQLHVAAPDVARVDLDAIRRGAAMMLFDPFESGSPMLHEDWPLLFS